MSWREIYRLTGVELFKFFTARATVGLACGSLVVSICAVVGTGLYLAGAAEEVSVGAALSLATLPVGVFVPIAAILIFTSDWQSGEMATYLALVRKRGSMFVAKLVSAVIVATLILAALVICAFAITAGLGFATGSRTDWEAAAPIGSLIAAVAVGSLCGAALGALLLSAPLAIAVSILQTLLIDPSLGFLPNDAGSYLRVASITGDWASLPSPWAAVTSALIWIVAPLAAGAIRFQRREP